MDSLKGLVVTLTFLVLGFTYLSATAPSKLFEWLQSSVYCNRAGMLSYLNMTYLLVPSYLVPFLDLCMCQGTIKCTSVPIRTCYYDHEQMLKVFQPQRNRAEILNVCYDPCITG